ncbi:MAG TPA: hypothetical protein VKO87_07165 [Gemmatimonadaceae bacterium]|nr:hypothetical protein [Gemmatimonadaceae bacterium]
MPSAASLRTFRVFSAGPAFERRSSSALSIGGSISSLPACAAKISLPTIFERSAFLQLVSCASISWPLISFVSISSQRVSFVSISSQRIFYALISSPRRRAVLPSARSSFFHPFVPP